MSKTVPLSVRVSEADATFIAKLKVPDAITPSEKVRVLISQARQRYQSTEDIAEAAAFVRALIEPQREAIRSAEAKSGVHSELVSRLGEWLPEFVAYFLASPISKAETPSDALSDLERGLVTRLTSLFESVLRMAVTRREPCYDSAAISSRLAGVIELVQLIEQGKRE